METAADDPASASPADLAIRSAVDLYDLEEGRVAAPQRNPQGTHVVLVRAAGERPAPMEEMTPAELIELRQESILEATRAFEERFLHPSSEWVRERYALHLASWNEQGDEQEDEPEGES
jgi:hypothetical protein